MPYLESSIEINAPPAKVREIFLDFPAYPEWHTDWIKGIEIEDNADKSKTGLSLTAGDKVKCNIEGFSFVAEIKENSEQLLSWQGPPVFTIAGLHNFRFESAKDGTATVFTQSEQMKGLLSFAMSPSLLGRFMRADYDVFNKDLKTRAEA
ncbi:Polyketide cyclase/dehydrase [Penicillium capsulatum]|uniref:Polyketide cyclase/dehydrase n=1 Tax=Penicillium capsulatum TaxID=69766 RepID=A0A9W9LF08_9EURO|nr:Polyketide cyclase/dehydrase [Penicillium capsulatum]KAJ6112833.1 Polyketide cyclase/dehydrase [Penicillium capsulatum]